MSPLHLNEAWFQLLKDEFEKPYFVNLKAELIKEYSTYKVYPKPDEVFKAFKLTKPDSIKVVILGLDPYPFGQGDGVAFSSYQDETPFSLQMILRELDRDLIKTTNLEQFKQLFPNNSLKPWCDEGVLLLNSCLTVRAGVVKSHHHLGWQKFISRVIFEMWKDDKPKVFVPMGNDAIETLYEGLKLSNEYDKHKIIETGHPAAAAHGKDTFSGCNMFSKIEAYLKSKNVTPIEWKLNK